jgi:hypothetical protein
MSPSARPTPSWRHLASRGFVVRRAVPLARAGEAPAFRLELADERVVKVRLFSSAGSARRIWDLLEMAGDSALPRPLLQMGRALVTEYIEGEPLDRYLLTAGRNDDARFIRATARLLARLHRRRTPRGAARTPDAYHQLLARLVQGLGRRKLLNAECSVPLLQLDVPADGPCSLTHGDVCPENLVLADRNRLRLIDEERLAIRPVAFDLARAVTRWPLDPRSEKGFLAAYRREGGDDRSFKRDRSFWIAMALATSAAYRMRRRLPGVRRPLAELRALCAAEGPRPGSSPRGRTRSR